MTGDGARREAARARLVGLVAPPDATGRGTVGTRADAAGETGWLPLPPGQGSASAPAAGDAVAPSAAVPAEGHAAPSAAVPAEGPAAPSPAVPAEGPADRTAGELAGRAAERDAGAASVRERALLSAVATYTAAYGHPLDHPAMDAPVGERRWAMPGRVAAAAIVALLLLVGLVVARVHGRPAAPTVPLTDAAPLDASQHAEPPGQGLTEEMPATPAAAGDAGSDVAAASTGAATAPGTVVVHVVGQVAGGGVVELPQGSRVGDAVTAAGGPAADADLTALNLARVVVDGEQIVVPRPGETPPPPQHGTPDPGAGAPAAPAGSPAGAPLDLNVADASALDALPGIGPVLAGRIVQWRVTHGRFTSIEELGEVAGIGPTLLEGIRDLVHV